MSVFGHLSVVVKVDDDIPVMCGQLSLAITYPKPLGENLIGKPRGAN